MIPATETEIVYDAFASHATDPDGGLVRAVESILEGFHRRIGIPQQYARELHLCVDGRDFVFPPRTKESGSHTIEPIVREYQRRSRSLLVFSGPLSRDHPWINREIECWGEERPDGPVYFVLTHGVDPSDHKEIMPQSLLARGGGDTAVFFDFRGYYRKLWALPAWAAPWRMGERQKSFQSEAWQ